MRNENQFKIHHFGRFDKRKVSTVGENHLPSVRRRQFFCCQQRQNVGFRSSRRENSGRMRISEQGTEHFNRLLFDFCRSRTQSRIAEVFPNITAENTAAKRRRIGTHTADDFSASERQILLQFFSQNAVNF